MGRATVFTIALIAFSAGVAAGVLGITWLVGGSGTPSEPISAPTLSLDPTMSPGEIGTQVASLDDKLDSVLSQLEGNAEAGAISTLSAQIDALQAEIASMSMGVAVTQEVMVETEEAEPTATLTPEPTVDPASVDASALSGRALFRIDNERSTVRFEIDEELSGLPNHVIGVTDQVAGDVIVDFDSPANSSVGEIRINARTFATDSEFRNRALRSEILESVRDEFEFISFVPLEMIGLPESVALNETISFQVRGNLTIRNFSNEVTFDVTATLVSDTRLDGTATTQVTREAYGLTIPSVPNVANVDDEVDLTIEFVARRVEE